MMNKSIALIFLICPVCFADSMSDQVKHELQKRNPDASKIEINFVQDPGIKVSADQFKVSIVEDVGPSEVEFRVIDKVIGNTIGIARAKYSIWKKAAVAKKRILPGEKISSESFLLEEVLVSQGMAREFRGVMISDSELLHEVESRQTILENQYITTTAVRRIPDVRKGDGVTIKLSSGEVQLSTPGIAEEASYLNNTIHVLSIKSKKVLVGTLIDRNLVEVKL